MGMNKTVRVTTDGVCLGQVRQVGGGLAEVTRFCYEDKIDGFTTRKILTERREVLTMKEAYAWASAMNQLLA